MRRARGGHAALGVLALAGLAALQVDARASDGGAPDSGALDAGLAETGPTDGGAVPSCNSLPGELLFAAGAARDYVVFFGQQLASALSPITIIFYDDGSCQGVADMVGGNSVTGAAQYYPPTGSPQDCVITTPVKPDVVFSDVFASTCGLDLTPGNIGDFWGPVTPVVFVTSPASTQQAISAEQAYVAFGVNDGTSKPWIDPGFLLTRGSGSGTQQLAGRAIDVPADQWWGVYLGAVSNTQIANFLGNLQPPDSDKGLAVQTTTFAAQFAPQVKPLAFQATGQEAAFWPSSTATANDMINVRDGHYPLWGLIHVFAPLGVDSQPSLKAESVTSRLTAIESDQALVDLAVAEKDVPLCAMEVRRLDEVGPLTPFAPAVGCGCYFEKAASGATSCQACSVNGDCPGTRPACNYGFCEVR